MDIDKRTRLSMIDYGTIGGTLIAGAAFFPLVGIPFLIGGTLARSYVSNNYSQGATDNRSEKDGFFYRFFDGIGNIYASILNGYKSFRDKTRTPKINELVAPQEISQETPQEIQDQDSFTPEEQTDNENNTPQYYCPFYGQASPYLEGVSRTGESLENSLAPNNINISQTSSNNLESIVQSQNYSGEIAEYTIIPQDNIYTSENSDKRTYLQAYLDKTYKDSNLSNVRKVKYLIDDDGDGLSIRRKTHLDKYEKDMKIDDRIFKYVDSTTNEDGTTYKYRTSD